jgi:multiple sugar transport system permease protein
LIGGISVDSIKIETIETKSKVFLLGNHNKPGFLKAAARYIVLAGIGFVYVYPLIYMISKSFLSPEDLADPSVIWIPTGIYFDNFKKAFSVLDFWNCLKNSIIVSVVAAILQTISTSFVSYGLARFKLPLKKVFIVLIVATFFIPVEITTVPRYVLFYRYGFINTLLPSYLPALFVQGLNSAIFILVFFMFFKSYPLAFDEAASIDGAGCFKIFYKIALPMSKPAILVSILFSTVWYWNETAQSQMYYGNKFPSLMHRLSEFSSRFASAMKETGGGSTAPTQAIILAATMLTMLPMILFYLATQKQFISSIEYSGITGE